MPRGQCAAERHGQLPGAARQLAPVPMDRSTRYVHDGQGCCASPSIRCGPCHRARLWRRCRYDRPGTPDHPICRYARRTVELWWLCQREERGGGASRSSSADRVSYSVHDAAYRLAYAIDAAGAEVRFDYDMMGQVIKRDRIRHAQYIQWAALPARRGGDGQLGGGERTWGGSGRPAPIIPRAANASWPSMPGVHHRIMASTRQAAPSGFLRPTTRSR